MNIVCDASFFFGSFPVWGHLWTTPQVVAELRDLASKSRFDALREEGLVISEPARTSCARVREAALSSGDQGVLSEADISILALAYEISGEIVTDDFAIQNVAAALEITIRPIFQRRAKKRLWKLVCTGCGRVVQEEYADCPVCGSLLRRRNK